jgi:hypothetical protein
LEPSIASNEPQVDSIRGGDKWMLLLGWSCFVGIGMIIAADLVVGVVRHLLR